MSWFFKLQNYFKRYIRKLFYFAMSDSAVTVLPFRKRFGSVRFSDKKGNSSDLACFGIYPVFNDALNIFHIGVVRYFNPLCKRVGKIASSPGDLNGAIDRIAHFSPASVTICSARSQSRTGTHLV
jgi:hypothetical protein